MADHDTPPGELDITDELIAERRGDPSGKMPDDMPRWMARTITGIDRFSLIVGNLSLIHI